MDDYESFSYSKWQCKYGVVFIPKLMRRQFVTPYTGSAPRAAPFRAGGFVL